MGISIVICTYNSWESLKICLTSLLNVQDSHIDYEIIIVDNNSSDLTKKLVKKFIKLNPRISYNFFPIQGLAKARNYGIKMTSKEFILFTDDDITFDENFLIAYDNCLFVILSYSVAKRFGTCLYPLYFLPKGNENIII